MLVIMILGTVSYCGDLRPWPFTHDLLQMSHPHLIIDALKLHKDLFNHAILNSTMFDANIGFQNFGMILDLDCAALSALFTLLIRVICIVDLFVSSNVSNVNISMDKFGQCQRKSWSQPVETLKLVKNKQNS